MDFFNLNRVCIFFPSENINNCRAVTEDSMMYPNAGRGNALPVGVSIDFHSMSASDVQMTDDKR